MTPKVNHPGMRNGMSQYETKYSLELPSTICIYYYAYNISIVAELVVVLAVFILVGLFCLQHHGPDKVG